VVCKVDDHAWNETTMTWANRPTVGACTAGPESVDPDSDVQWDVTSLIGTGESIDLAIVSNDTDGAHYVSKESGGAVTGPRLLLTTTDGSPTSGASGGGGGPSSGGTAANGAANGIDEDGASAEGCGCRTARRDPPTGAALLSAAAVLLLAARRRDRRACAVKTS
jgi:MYXO-CTERM domain-containing protein